MAEFCYSCYIDILSGDKEKAELVISKGLDLCEGCGEYEQIVILEKSRFRLKLDRMFNKLQTSNYTH
jgi:hypothetical protein